MPDMQDIWYMSLVKQMIDPQGGHDPQLKGRFFDGGILSEMGKQTPSALEDEVKQSFLPSASRSGYIFWIY